METLLNAKTSAG